jgi:hypothetical protein
MKSYLTYLALLASSVTADVHFETGSWSGEVRWEIVDASGKALCTGGPYPRNYEKYENVCELGGGKYTVNCHDTWGDGWNGGFMRVGDTKLCSTRFGRDTSETFEIKAESFDTQSTGGHLGNDWHKHNDRDMPTGSITRGHESTPNWGTPTNADNNGKPVIEALKK